MPAKFAQAPAGVWQVPAEIAQAPLKFWRVPAGYSQVPAKSWQVPAGLRQACPGVRQAPAEIGQRAEEGEPHGAKTQKNPAQKQLLANSHFWQEIYRKIILRRSKRLIFKEFTPPEKCQNPPPERRRNDNSGILKQGVS